MKKEMIINSSQKDDEVFCVALVTEINDPSAKYVNLEKNLIIRRFGLSPSSGIITTSLLDKCIPVKSSKGST